MHVSDGTAKEHRDVKVKFRPGVNPLLEFLLSIAYGGSCQWQVPELEQSTVDFRGLITYNMIILPGGTGGSRKLPELEKFVKKI